MAINGDVADDKLPSVEKEQTQSPTQHEFENGLDDPEKSAEVVGLAVAKDDFEPVVTLKTWIVCVVSVNFGAYVIVQLRLLIIWLDLVTWLWPFVLGCASHGSNW